MYYYNTYYDSTDNENKKRVFRIADEILCYYFKDKENNKVILRTRDFLEALENYLLGSTSFIVDPSRLVNYFSSNCQVGDEIGTIKNEIYLAINRVKYFIDNGQILDFGFDHNARFVDWMLVISNLIDRQDFVSPFEKINVEYLSNNKMFFTPDLAKNINSEDRFKKLFLKNALRAERYAHTTYFKRPNASLITSLDDLSNEYDVYTPLILSRMAVEQFLKHKYTTCINQRAKLPSVSTCRFELEKLGFISKTFSNEIYTVIKRGNDSAHLGLHNFVFAIMQGLNVLKQCWIEWDK